MQNTNSDAGNDIVFLSNPAHRQDRWVIQDVLKGLRGGYFVEAGAGGASNTFALEANFGWTGLGVEPHPEQFQNLKKTRHCVLENVCLADVESEVEFLMNPNVPGTSGIRDAMGDIITDNFFGKGVKTETIRVKAYPLAELLSKHGAPTHIDYLSLDVEGAEWLILKNFPFDRYSFGCMTIERSSNDYFRLRAKLRDLGYRLVRVGGADDFWVHPSIKYATPLRDLINVHVRCIVQPIKARLRRAMR